MDMEYCLSSGFLIINTAFEGFLLFYYHSPKIIPCIYRVYNDFNLINNSSLELLFIVFKRYLI